MLVDLLWANLAVFAVGQLVAVGYLRTGRFWNGMAATVVLWATLDWWLVARFVFALPEHEQRLPLAGLQVTAATTLLAWTWARLRRRAGRATRLGRYRAGMQQLLSGDGAVAAATFRSLSWSDPWDASARVALGDALRCAGDLRGARRAYRRAAGIDPAGAMADLLAHRRAMLAIRARQHGSSAATAPGAGRDGGGAAKGALRAGPAARPVAPAASSGPRRQAR